MATKEGLEVKGFNQLRTIYNKETTFLVSAFRNKVVYQGTDDDDGDLAPIQPSPQRKRRSARRNSEPGNRSRERHPRAPSRAKSDQTYEAPRDQPGGTDPIKLTIKGDRKFFWPPSDGYRKILAKPKGNLVLDWVYGCRGGLDVAKNLWILKSGELVYFVSNVVVIYNRLKETQKHYTGHTEEIMCMDVHPEKNLALSGQKSGKIHESRAHIRLWDTKSLETLVVLGFGEYELGVSAVAFSTNM